MFGCSWRSILGGLARTQVHRWKKTQHYQSLTNTNVGVWSCWSFQFTKAIFLKGNNDKIRLINKITQSLRDKDFAMKQKWN